MSTPFVDWGATVRVIVPDNLKESVLTPDIYDPALNPLYRDVLAHYGVVALPCRRRRSGSQRQGRGRVGHAQKTSWKASASRRSSPRRRTSNAGRRTGPTRASMARRNARSRRCLPRSGRRSGHSRSSHFGTTASARPDKSANGCRCSGTTCTCASGGSMAWAFSRTRLSETAIVMGM